MKKLYRSATNKKFAGVCGGIAEYFGLDADLVRLITAVLVLVGGLSIWVYIIAAVILPEEVITYTDEPAAHNVNEAVEKTEE